MSENRHTEALEAQQQNLHAACSVCERGGNMKKAEFKEKYGYRDQAPRCYLCAFWGWHSCRVEKGVEVKVRPNGICRAYKTAAHVKEA